MRSFYLPFVVFVLACALVLVAVLYLNGSLITPHYAGVLLYFAAVTGFLHYWQENALVTDPKGFVRRFMAGLMLKMLLSMVVLVLLLFTAPKPIAIPLALSFAVLYLAFLAFSTLRLMKLSRGGPKP